MLNSQRIPANTLSVLPKFWTSIASPQLNQAVNYYRSWLIDRSTVLNPTHTERVILLKIYLTEYLGANCWGDGEAIEDLRKLADNITTIEQVGQLHQILNTCGIEPIHWDN
jgi:hypothetical protein